MARPPVEQEEQIVLTSRESVQLFEMIENPPPRNDKFISARARYQQIKCGMGTTVGRADCETHLIKVSENPQYTIAQLMNEMPLGLPKI